MRFFRRTTCAFALIALSSGFARAEVSEIVVAQQYGVSFLPLMVDKRAAAQLYLDVSKDTKNSVEDILAIISEKDYAYTLKPQKVIATAAFMAKVGSVKQAPATLGDLFFPEASTLGGD